MKVFFKGGSVQVEVKKLSSVGMGRGLMARSRNTGNLLFEFRNPRFCAIHSFFVFFPFLVLWLDSQNRVQEWSLVRPFTFHVRPRCSSAKLIEVPVNEKNKKLIELFVGRGKI